MDTTLRTLLDSSEPSIRYRTRTGILGEDPHSPAMEAMQAEIRCSPRAEILLSERDAGGTIPRHPYEKWRGAHWVLYVLAEMSYPPGDESLIALREQVYGWLRPLEEARPRVVDGRVRHCASFEGNALYYLVTLGLADERAHRLADRLLAWQWPDGGWNCDKHPEACHSSFHETMLPLRGLAVFARWTGRDDVRQAAERAAEVFLSRSLFRRRSTGEVIRPDFTKLHYPAYWHYDILGGLRAIYAAGLIGDTRCQEALDLLEAKRTAQGGFPLEKSYQQNRPGGPLGCSLLTWGPGGTTRSNPFVTVEALTVLKAAGRLKVSEEAREQQHTRG